MQSKIPVEKRPFKVSIHYLMKCWYFIVVDCQITSKHKLAFLLTCICINQCNGIGVDVYRYWPKNWTYAAQTDSHCPEPTNFYLCFVISCAIIEDDFRFFLGNMIASICCRSYERKWVLFDPRREYYQSLIWSWKRNWRRRNLCGQRGARFTKVKPYCVRHNRYSLNM